MKIAVIGHLCLDSIRHSDGTVTESYGGIYFTLATLAHLLPEGDTIVPVFGIGRNEYQPFIDHLGGFPAVDTSALYRMPGPTNSVTLSYRSNGDRVEVSKNIPDPIPWQRIQDVCDADLILVNMISGFDITLETLDEIRMKTRDRQTPVFFDVHSLTLGIRHNAERFHRPVELWRRWLFMLHTVQMNAEEAAVLAPERYDEENLVKQALALNTEALCITRGADGYTLFLSEKKRIKRSDIDAVPVEKAVDSTGCGDVFGAAYCARLLHGGDIAASAEYAGQVASIKAGIAGSADLSGIERFRIEPATAGGEKS